jgi:hypothetical protein
MRKQQADASSDEPSHRGTAHATKRDRTDRIRRPCAITTLETQQGSGRDADHEADRATGDRRVVHIVRSHLIRAMKWQRHGRADDPSGAAAAAT